MWFQLSQRSLWQEKELIRSYNITLGGMIGLLKKEELGEKARRNCVLGRLLEV